MLTYVPIASLSALWPQVRPLIERSNGKWGQRNMPEELYHALRQNMAALYVADGGMVIAQRVLELDGTVTCFIWLVVGDLAEKREEMQRALEELAGTIGAVRLRMASPSPAWGRASQGYWAVHQVTYEHKLGGEHALDTDLHQVAA
jgi:hypothetical protein